MQAHDEKDYPNPYTQHALSFHHTALLCLFPHLEARPTSRWGVQITNADNGRVKHGKIPCYFNVLAGDATYLEGERYGMHNLVAMALISLLAALSLLFVVTL
jgi:hypothetical protein